MFQSHLSLVLSSRLESLERLESFITDVIMKTGIDEDMRGNVMISTMEAVTNAMRHGNKLNPDKKVFVDVKAESTRLQICVMDEGHGYIPSLLNDPTDPAFLEVEGGRGVYLMKALSDEITFHNEGREVHMCFACDCDSHQQAAFSLEDAMTA